ncbi:MAG: class I SAM-dependent methyltransferase [Gammaproteobacteria bacterium]
MIELQAKWDRLYANNRTTPKPAEVLETHQELLPKRGKALDLACGLGGNAILLAGCGLSVDAWDISGFALSHLEEEATRRRLTVTCRQCSIASDIMPTHCYDVIVISRFLDRSLSNEIMAALKPAGLLFYQTFTRTKTDDSGPNNPDYLLNRNELLRLFAPLTVVYYQEYARIGDLTVGNRNEACFIGQNT